MHIYKFDVVAKRMLWGQEDWILSSMPGSETTVVAPESEKGLTLQQLINKYGERIIGKNGDSSGDGMFPLLIKFIDAHQDLSIQVHPDDEYALKHHQSLGKNEMWYIVDAEEGTRFKVGFNRKITPEEYERRIADSTILEVINDVAVERGDVFYIPAGRVHSISGGSSLLEVQQSSNITYRLFDYNRIDKDGNPRELHTQHAKNVLVYEALEECKTACQAKLNEEAMLVDVPSFTTSLLLLDKETELDHTAIDSFVLYISTKGCATITSSSGDNTTLNERELVLIPAEEKGVRIVPEGRVELMKVHIRQ